MNFKLANDFSFSAVIIDGSNIFPNFYNIKINMETMTENNNYQNIAIQRILVFLQEMLDGCIFCSENNPIATKFIRLAKESRVILFPEEPYDQVIGMILFHKLNAITEDMLQVESVIISSELGENLTYTIDEFAEFEFMSAKVEIPWWDRSDLSVSNNIKQIKLTESWKDINLDWGAHNMLDVSVGLVDNSKQPEVIILDGGATA